DSVPAVLAVTRDPLIVYSSNVLALVGLRSLYFVVSDALERLRYLRLGLAACRVLPGAKRMGSAWGRSTAALAVGIIGLVLGVTIVASLSRARTTSPRP